MAMRVGHGEVVAPTPPDEAFAFLADPHNAPEWFAAVTCAPDELRDATATRPLPSARFMQAGATWRFVPRATTPPGAPARAGRATPRTRAPIPVRMATYAPPTRFTWETTYPATRDNLRWEITCAPTDAIDAEGETAAGNAPGNVGAFTRIHLALRIQPGPLGWVSLLLATPFTRGALDRRAQRALDRARETLAARAELKAQPRPPRARPPRDTSQRGRKRH